MKEDAEARRLMELAQRLAAEGKSKVEIESAIQAEIFNIHRHAGHKAWNQATHEKTRLDNMRPDDDDD